VASSPPCSAGDALAEQRKRRDASAARMLASAGRWRGHEVMGGWGGGRRGLNEAPGPPSGPFAKSV
jgi:hypothetical protein